MVDKPGGQDISGGFWEISSTLAGFCVAHVLGLVGSGIVVP